MQNSTVPPLIVSQACPLPHPFHSLSTLSSVGHSLAALQLCHTSPISSACPALLCPAATIHVPMGMPLWPAEAPLPS